MAFVVHCCTTMSFQTSVAVSQRGKRANGTRKLSSIDSNTYLQATLKNKKVRPSQQQRNKGKVKMRETLSKRNTTVLGLWRSMSMLCLSFLFLWYYYGKSEIWKSCQDFKEIWRYQNLLIPKLENIYLPKYQVTLEKSYRNLFPENENSHMYNALKYRAELGFRKLWNGYFSASTSVKFRYPTLKLSPRIL